MGSSVSEEGSETGPEQFDFEVQLLFQLDPIWKLAFEVQLTFSTGPVSAVRLFSSLKCLKFFEVKIGTPTLSLVRKSLKEVKMGTPTLSLLLNNVFGVVSTRLSALLLEDLFGGLDTQKKLQNPCFTSQKCHFEQTKRSSKKPVLRAKIPPFSVPLFRFKNMVCIEKSDLLLSYL